MRKHIHAIVGIACAAALVTGCASQPPTMSVSVGTHAGNAPALYVSGTNFRTLSPIYVRLYDQSGRFGRTNMTFLLEEHDADGAWSILRTIHHTIDPQDNVMQFTTYIDFADRFKIVYIQNNQDIATTTFTVKA